MSRHSSEFNPMSLVLPALLGVFVLLMVASTGDWSLLGIAPGLRLQLFGQGTVAYDALTPTSRSFGSRTFYVREGDTVALGYTLKGQGGSAHVSVSVCDYNLLRPSCEIIHLERLVVPSGGSVVVPVPAGGRCRATLSVRDYTGGLTLRWDRQGGAPGIVSWSPSQGERGPRLPQRATPDGLVSQRSVPILWQLRGRGGTECRETRGAIRISSSTCASWRARWVILARCSRWRSV